MKIFKVFIAATFLFSSSRLAAQQSDLTPDQKEVEAAEARMFQNMNFTHSKEYYKTDVSDDFFTINADGVWADKKESLADTARQKMVEMAKLKIVDKKIRVYGDVGITNGRGKVYFNDQFVLEFLYTTIFVKKNGKWMYTGWQGTISKDSPKMPPPGN
jgi:hypothetical protein